MFARCKAPGKAQCYMLMLLTVQGIRARPSEPFYDITVQGTRARPSVFMLRCLTVQGTRAGPSEKMSMRPHGVTRQGDAPWHISKALRAKGARRALELLARKMRGRRVRHQWTTGRDAWKPFLDQAAQSRAAVGSRPFFVSGPRRLSLSLSRQWRSRARPSSWSASRPSGRATPSSSRCRGPGGVPWGHSRLRPPWPQVRHMTARSAVTS